MEIKQFLAQTIEVLVNYSEQQQVDAFNEIKFALLSNREERQKAIARQIEELQSLDKLIYSGNSAIRGEDLMLKANIDPSHLNVAMPIRNAY